MHKAFCLTVTTSSEVKPQFLKVGMFCTHPRCRMCSSAVSVTAMSTRGCNHIVFQLCQINYKPLRRQMFVWSRYGTAFVNETVETLRLQSILLLCSMTQSVTWLPSVSKGGTHSAGDPERSPLMRWNRLTSPSVWSGMKNKCHGGWQRASVSYQPGQCEWWLLSGPLLRGCLLS